MLATLGGREGRTGMCSFPLGTFEAAICAWRREIDSREIMGRNEGPDEVQVLSGELSRVESSIAFDRRQDG